MYLDVLAEVIYLLHKLVPDYTDPLSSVIENSCLINWTISLFSQSCSLLSQKICRFVVSHLQNFLVVRCQYKLAWYGGINFEVLEQQMLLVQIIGYLNRTQVLRKDMVAPWKIVLQPQKVSRAYQSAGDVRNQRNSHSNYLQFIGNISQTLYKYKDIQFAQTLQSLQFIYRYYNNTLKL